MADHYEHLESQGKEIDDFFLPDFPKIISHVWGWWVDMNSERPNNGMSISALSSKFMYDYLSVYNVKALDVEMRVLKAIEREYLEAVNDRHRSSNN